MLTDRSRALLARVNYNGLKLDDDGNLPNGVSWATINTLEMKLMIDRVDAAWSITKIGRQALMEHVPRLLSARQGAIRYRTTSPAEGAKRGRHVVDESAVGHQDYTAMPHFAMAGEPEAVDEFTLERFAEDNRARFLAAQASLEQRFSEAIRQARNHGIDVRFQEAAIAKRVAVIERKILARTQAA